MSSVESWRCAPLSGVGSTFESRPVSEYEWKARYAESSTRVGRWFASSCFFEPCGCLARCRPDGRRALENTSRGTDFWSGRARCLAVCLPGAVSSLSAIFRLGAQPLRPAAAVRCIARSVGGGGWHLLPRSGHREQSIPPKPDGIPAPPVRAERSAPPPRPRSLTPACASWGHNRVHTTVHC